MKKTTPVLFTVMFLLVMPFAAAAGSPLTMLTDAVSALQESVASLTTQVTSILSHDAEQDATLDVHNTQIIEFANNDIPYLRQAHSDQIALSQQLVANQDELRQQVDAFRALAQSAADDNVALRQTVDEQYAALMETINYNQQSTLQLVYDLNWVSNARLNDLESRISALEAQNTE